MGSGNWTRIGDKHRSVCTTHPTANGNSQRGLPRNDQDGLHIHCSHHCGKPPKNLIVKPMLSRQGVYNPLFYMENKNVNCSYNVFHKLTALMMRVNFEI